MRKHLKDLLPGGENPQLMTTETFSRVTGLPPYAIIRKVKRGELESVVLSHTALYDVEDAERMI